MSGPDLSSPGVSPQRALERDAHDVGRAASDLHIVRLQVADGGPGPARRPAPEVSIVFVEINETERHFIQAGRSPRCSRV
jgi:hypothetical protein